MIQSINYTVKEGERWDSLAWKFYGSVKAMNVLIDNNPSIPLSAVLAAGTQVVIPIIDKTNDIVTKTNLPPWKR